MENQVIRFTARESDKIRSHRKENGGFIREYAVFDLDDLRGPTITARVYWPGQVAYACVWINSESAYARGAGKAGGYGYCKESAAMAYALADAGVTLRDDIDGRGTQAIRYALLALAAHTGVTRPMLHVAHA